MCIRDRFGARILAAPHLLDLSIGVPPGRYKARELAPKLHGWVRRKLGVTDQGDVVRISWAVARKIETRGIRARRFITRATNITAKNRAWRVHAATIIGTNWYRAVGRKR